MIQTKTITINGTANKETLQDILTSTVDEKYHVISVLITEVTSTPNNDAMIEAMIDRKTIHQIPIYQFNESASSATRYYPSELPIDVDINVGSTLQVGHVSGATASNITYTVKFETK